MTMDDEQLDSWIRTRVAALVESAPLPPAQLGTVRRRRSSRRLLLPSAIVGAVVAAGAILSGTWPSAVKPVSASTIMPIHSAVAGIVSSRIPRSAIHGGRVNWSDVPTYVAVISDGSVVGYVQKADIDGQLPVIGPLNGGTYTPVCGSDGINVYASNDTTIVGALYPNLGYVPAGQTPNCANATTPTTVSQP